MALALDTDFRTALSAAGPENGLRRTPEGGSGGEEFARNLQRAREAELASSEPVSAEASLVPAPPSLPPVISAAIAEDSATIQRVTGSAPLPTTEVSAEVEPGATLAAADTAAVAAPTVVPAAVQAVIPVDPAAPSTGMTISSAPMADAQPAQVAATPADAAPAPAPSKSSDTASAVPPVMTEQPVLAAAAAVVAAPGAAKAADQTGRTPNIAEAGAAPGRPLAKTGMEGSAPRSADAQAAIDAASPDLINASATAPADPALVSALTSDTGGSSGTPGNSLGLAATPSAAAPAITTSPVAAPMAPTNAMVIASPAAVVDIVSQAAEDGQSDRIVVQLDPPELGRISIDFKFDAQGLQHVTITSETPEAMRQLRMMHADLVQALERQGIAGQNMTFEHQQQSAQQAPLPNPFARSAAFAGPSDDEATAAIAAADLRQTARTLPGGRLDIRF
jgi:flagellar hook-length control protein FliK